MFGLPKSTEISKQLPKKAIFEKFKPNPADKKHKKLFDEQINRISIVGEISPQTVNTSPGDEVKAIYILLVTMKTKNCDKKNIALLSKLIDQKMLFALEYGDEIQFASYRTGRVLISESKPLKSWEIKLNGLDLDSFWDNMIAAIMGIDLAEGKTLDEIIIENEEKEKLIKQIAILEKKARNEKQPRKKIETVQQIKILTSKLGE